MPNDPESDTTIATPTADKILLNPAEAAALLSVSERTLWNLTENGHIRCLRIGELKRYRRAALEAFAENEELSPSETLQPRPRKPREGHLT
jgi:excisionase family DNA binding protein